MMLYVDLCQKSTSITVKIQSFGLNPLAIMATSPIIACLCMVAAPFSLERILIEVKAPAWFGIF
jgi:hypothetical protein